MSGIGNVFNGLSKWDPINLAIDAGADAIGVPKEIKNITKVAVGAATGDGMVAAQGASKLIEDGTKGTLFNSKAAPAQDRARSVATLTAGCRSAAVEASGFQVDPYGQTLEALLRHWPAFAFAAGRTDGLVGRCELEAVLNRAGSDPSDRAAAGFLLAHPDVFHRLDTAAGIGFPDGLIGLSDVNAEKARVGCPLPALVATVPAVAVPPAFSWRPAPCAPIAPAFVPLPPSGVPIGAPGVLGFSAPSFGHPLPSMVCRPGMSTEDQVQAMLAGASDSLDAEILDTVQQIDQASASGSATQGRDLEQLQLKLQQLMQRRAQMFELRSNLSEKFNEMAKVAIQNLGKA